MKTLLVMMMLVVGMACFADEIKDLKYVIESISSMFKEKQESVESCNRYMAYSRMDTDKYKKAKAKKDDILKDIKAKYTSLSIALNGQDKKAADIIYQSKIKEFEDVGINKAKLVTCSDCNGSGKAAVRGKLGLQMCKKCKGNGKILPQKY